MERHGAASDINGSGEGIPSEKDRAITVQDSISEISAFLGDRSVREVVGLGVYEARAPEDTAGLQGRDPFGSVEVQDAAGTCSIGCKNSEGSAVCDAFEGAEGQFAPGSNGDVSISGPGESGGAPVKDGKFSGEGVVAAKDDIPGAG